MTLTIKLVLTNALSLILFFHTVICSAQSGQQRPINWLPTGLSLEDNLYILNMWGEQPTHIQDVYKHAFRILEQKPHSSFADIARNAGFQKLCRKHGIIHLGGPMLGDIRQDGAKVWVRTVQPSRVEVRLVSEGRERVFGPEVSNEDSDLTAIVHVSGLKAGTSYPFRVYVNGVEVKNAGNHVLTTLPDSDLVTDARIVAGTCFHRWGIGNQNQVRQILSRKPLAMLLGGDIAVQDRENKTGMHRADYLLRDFMPAWQHLAGSVPVYTTWDDHDYFNNDKAGIPEGFTNKDREAVWNVFRQAWNNPAYGFGEQGKGVFFRTRIGPADVIMVDNRYFRTGEKGSFLGDEQMKWLEDQLLDCKGPFIILSCGTMWSDYVSGGKDSWGVNDPEGRERLFNLIEKNRIGGVILISGDRHGARGFKIPRPSGFNFYEFELGSLGGRTGPPPVNTEWETQLFGISGIYAFGEFSFNTTLDDPEVTFRLIQDRGTILYEITLTRSQLTPNPDFIRTEYEQKNAN
jgi:alkaline phosphatase D